MLPLLTLVLVVVGTQGPAAPLPPGPDRATPPPAVVLGPAPRPVGPRGPASWTAPLEGPLVVRRRFAAPREHWLPGHRGVDLAAHVGDLVRSAGDGTVAWAAPIAGRGVLVVRHPDGRRTTYEPVDAIVAVGETVLGGDPIGLLAPGDGHCGGPPSCLHWGLRRGRDYLDPMLLLRPVRPVLLPP